MSNRIEERAGNSMTALVRLARSFAVQLVGGERVTRLVSDNETTGQRGMAAAKTTGRTVLVTTSDDGEEVRVSVTELIKAFELDQFEPGLEIVDSDIASDERFEKTIREKLNTVGNSCFGNVGAALERDPSIDESSRSLIKSYFNSQSV